MTQSKEKIHFQVERIAFFSDALIAIAVTLLIIEIKAPHIEAGSSLSDQLNQLQHLLPEFISFIISFAIIISQWVKHHTLFGNIHSYDKKLITLNSFFLFAVTIIPFSTSYFAHNNISQFYLPYLIYGGSLIFLSILNFLLFTHSVNPKNRLFATSLGKQHVNVLKAEYLLFPVSIAGGLLLGFISLNAGLFTYVFLIIMGSAIIKRKKKKLTGIV